MTTKPLIASRPLAGTPTAYIDVVIAWMTSAPTMLANSEKRPPAPRAVPPITTARIASSSKFSPMLLASDVRMLELATRPAMPAQKPQNMYAMSLIALLVDAAVEARPRVDPDRLGERPERRAAGDEPRDDEDHGHDEQRDRQDDPAVPEEGVRLVEDLDADAVGDELGDPAAGDHQDQRGDHGLDPGVGDEHAVPDAAQRRDERA